MALVTRSSLIWVFRMNSVGYFKSQDFFELLENLSNGMDMEVYFAFRSGRANFYFQLLNLNTFLLNSLNFLSCVCKVGLYSWNMLQNTDHINYFLIVLLLLSYWKRLKYKTGQFCVLECYVLYVFCVNLRWYKRKWRGRARVLVGGGECLESGGMESGSWRDCCQSGVNPAIPIYGDKPESKLDWLINDLFFIAGS